MPTFTKVVIYAAATLDAPVAPAEPDLAAMYELVPQIHRLLLDGDGAISTPIAIGRWEPLTALWIPCGQTAGIACWTREAEVQAVSIIAAGLDDAEDARAAKVAARLCNLPAWGRSPCGHAALARRPLLATLHGPPAAVRDEAVATASAAWATAFFAMLGVDQEELTDLRP